MKVPAFCDNCGSIFPSGFEVTFLTDMAFSGCVSGPCPSCGGNGHIPDGILHMIERTTELLGSPNRTTAELDRLANILIQIRNQGASLPQAVQWISQEVPELAALSHILPRTPGDFYAFIKIILGITTIVLGQLKKNSRQKVEINQVLKNVYQQQAITSQPAKPQKIVQPKTKPIGTDKIGRNQPCPCGSGKKYKKCCLGKKAATYI